MKSIIRGIIKSLPVAITKNQRYDFLTVKIMKQCLKEDHNCIDVGVLEGEILDHFIKIAPKGQHFGFEPLPNKYAALKKKYAQQKNLKLYHTALGNTKGTTAFNYVTSNPGYSGIRKRKYDRPGEKDTQIKVNITSLDSIIDELPPIRMIKIDVEGAEHLVIKGAQQLLKRDHPIVIFEHGKGGADIYGFSPGEMYDLLAQHGYQIFLLKDYLKNKNPLSREELCTQFHQQINYYFLAE